MRGDYLPSNNKNEISKYNMNKLCQDKNWLYEKYWEEKLNMCQIAKLCNTHNVAIWRLMIKNNIPRRSISETKKGKKSHRKGINLEEEYGIKRAQEIREKCSKGNKGKHLSFKTEFTKGIVPWNKDKKMPPLTKEHIKKCLRRRTPSSLEEKFQKIIDKYNLPYKFVGNGKFFIERYNPDFINTNHEKIAVEVYARYYKLRHDKTIEEWKKERSGIFAKYGWKVIYFNEMEVNEKNILNALLGVM